MKILVCTPLWGYWGGREQYIMSCIEELTRLGHVCSVVFGRASARHPQPRLPDISLHPIAGYSEFADSGDATSHDLMDAVLNLERPDVVFASDIGNVGVLSSLQNYGGLVPMSHDNWLTCMRGTATTYIRRRICSHALGPRCLLHGCALKKPPDGRGLIYNSLMKHRNLLDIYRVIGRHVVASNYVKGRLVQHGFKPDDVKVIPYYTNWPQTEPITAKPDVPGVVFVGRVDRYKGLDYLLRALAKVAVPFRCSVIGDGDYLPHCRALADKLGLAHKVMFFGWRPNQAVAAAVRAASVLVVPSLWPEAFGIVGIEAMMCSTPAIAFDTGGISDWLKNGHNGFLVPVKDTAGLAERLGVLLGDPIKAANMGRIGQRMALEQFSKTNHFRKLLAVFDEAALGRRDGAGARAEHRVRQQREGS